MLDFYAKRKVRRMIGPNKVVELQQSAFEVLAAPVGVNASDLLDCHTIAIRHLIKEQEETNDLLSKILGVAREKTVPAQETQESAGEEVPSGSEK